MSLPRIALARTAGPTGGQRSRQVVVHLKHGLEDFGEPILSVAAVAVESLDEQLGFFQGLLPGLITACSRRPIAAPESPNVSHSRKKSRSHRTYCSWTSRAGIRTAAANTFASSSAGGGGAGVFGASGSIDPGPAEDAALGVAVKLPMP